ncbi:MAG: GNAT family N-acetyltransferase [Bacteroidetes bacterium]|nr:GNAT family N-acetyltransferase [Bacteroidota bacterium]
MNIQKLSVNDIKQQAIVHSLSFRTAYKGIIPDSFLESFTIEKREKFFTDEFEKYKDTFTIKEGEKLAGFCTIGNNRDEDKADDVGEIWGIYIHPTYWRRGYGTRLFEHVKSKLIARRYAEITLWVLRQNTAARAFYEKYGFSWDGTSKGIEIGKKLVEIRYSFIP